MSILKLSDLKVGGRVIGIKDYMNRNLVGLKGTILRIGNSISSTIHIRWDKDMDGHDCDGLCKDGYGWEVHNRHIRLLPQNDIIQKLKESMLR